MEKVDYLSVKISCKQEFTEILVAELSIRNYDSMMETEEGLEAYINKNDYNEADIIELKDRYAEAEISFTTEEVRERNWNEEWEKNYDPIRVEDKIMVRATFHQPEPNFEYDLVINPRMSFGTGHHATTYLMLKHQLEIDHKNKRVLDAGCGTAILAVMAEKLGAKDVLAYDNNSWSTENAPENIELNSCQFVDIQEGTIDTIHINGEYDIILANINKNVLLDEMDKYVSYLKSNGTLVLSGFYTKDNDDIIKRAEGCGLSFSKGSERNDWSSLIFHNK